MFTLSFANILALEETILGENIYDGCIGSRVLPAAFFKPGYLPPNNLSRGKYLKKFPQK